MLDDFCIEGIASRSDAFTAENLPVGEFASERWSEANKREIAGPAAKIRHQDDLIFVKKTLVIVGCCDRFIFKRNISHACSHESVLQSLDCKSIVRCRLF